MSLEKSIMHEQKTSRGGTLKTTWNDKTGRRRMLSTPNKSNESNVN